MTEISAGSGFSLDRYEARSLSQFYTLSVRLVIWYTVFTVHNNHAKSSRGKKYSLNQNTPYK